MTSAQKRLVDLVEYIPAEDVETVFSVVSRFVPDDIATKQDKTDIAKARQEFLAHKTVTHSQINWA